MPRKIFIAVMALVGIYLFGPVVAQAVQAWGNNTPIFTQFTCQGLISCTPTAGATVILAVPSSSPTSSGDIAVSSSYPYRLAVNPGLCLASDTAVHVTCAGPTNTPYDVECKADPTVTHCWPLYDAPITPNSPGPCATSAADIVAASAAPSPLPLTWPSNAPWCGYNSITGDGETGTWFGGNALGTPGPTLNYVYTFPIGALPAATASPYTIAFMTSFAYNSAGSFFFTASAGNGIEFGCNGSTGEVELDNGSTELQAAYSNGACYQGPTYWMYVWLGGSPGVGSDSVMYINGRPAAISGNFVPQAIATTSGYVGRGNSGQTSPTTVELSKITTWNVAKSANDAQLWYKYAKCGGQPAASCVPQ